MCQDFFLRICNNSRKILHFLGTITLLGGKIKISLHKTLLWQFTAAPNCTKGRLSSYTLWVASWKTATWNPVSYGRHPCAIPIPLRASPRPAAAVLCVNAIESNERPPSQQRPLPDARLFHSLCGGLVDASGASWGQPRDPDFSPMQLYRALVLYLTSIPFFSWYLLVASRTSKPFRSWRCRMACRVSSH